MSYHRQNGGKLGDISLEIKKRDSSKMTDQERAEYVTDVAWHLGQNNITTTEFLKFMLKQFDEIRGVKLKTKQEAKMMKTKYPAIRWFPNYTSFVDSLPKKFTCNYEVRPALDGNGISVTETKA